MYVDPSLILNEILNLFKLWVKMLWISISNIHIIWVTIPIYVVWISTELFQEKHETSYGNAATNGVIVSYVSLDWLRQMFQGNVKFDLLKVIIAILLVLYGIFVVIESIKKKPVAKHIGRIKYISYFQVMFTVLVYSDHTNIPLSVESVSAIILGFPIVWIVTYLMDKYLPDLTYEESEGGFTETLQEPLQQEIPFSKESDKLKDIKF